MEKNSKNKGGKLKWIIIIIVVIAIIGAVAGNGEDEAPKKVENTESKEKDDDVKKDSTENDDDEATEFKVGETAEQKDIQITFVSTTESVGGDFVKPSTGKVYLICEFEIVNNSNKDITISSIANFEAYCDDYSIDQDIMGLQAPEANGKNQLDGDVASGKKMKGVIVYEVPSNWQKLEINVSPDFWSSKDFKFVATK